MIDECTLQMNRRQAYNIYKLSIVSFLNFFITDRENKRHAEFLEGPAKKKKCNSTEEKSVELNQVAEPPLLLVEQLEIELENNEDI